MNAVRCKIPNTLHSLHFSSWNLPATSTRMSAPRRPTRPGSRQRSISWQSVGDQRRSPKHQPVQEAPLLAGPQEGIGVRLLLLGRLPRGVWPVLPRRRRRCLVRLLRRLQRPPRVSRRGRRGRRRRRCFEQRRGGGRLADARRGRGGGDSGRPPGVRECACRWGWPCRPNG